MLLVRVYISLLATYYVTGQSFITSPRNTAAKTGTSARLNCTADLQGDTLEWRQFVNEVVGERIVASSQPNNIMSGFDLDYDADSGRYDLIMESVNDQLAGKYLCHVLHEDLKGEAQIVSLSGLSCDTVGDISNVTAGTRLSLTCGVSYNGYKKPNLKWYDDDTVISGAYKPESETSKSRLYTVNITIEDRHLQGKPFRCELDFTPEPGEVGEPPLYTDHCPITFGDSPDSSTWPRIDAGSMAQHNLFLLGSLLLFVTIRSRVQFGS